MPLDRHYRTLGKKLEEPVPTPRAEFLRQRDAMLRDFKAWLATSPPGTAVAEEVRLATEWLLDAANEYSKANPTK